MRIHTRVEMHWDESAQAYVLVREEGFDLPDGVPVAMCKGASSQMTDIANKQQSFGNTLSNDYGQQFANQSAILGSLNSSLKPIVNAGAGQYGFSNAEDAAMRSQASSGTTAAYNTAKQATGENMAAMGGGNEFLGSGVEAQQKAGLAQAAAQQDANQQLGITQAGYAQGRQNFFNAVGADQGVASQYNPLGYAGTAGAASSSAYNEAQTNNQMNIAGSPWSIAGGILGGALGQAEGAFGAPKSMQPAGASAWDPQEAYGVGAQTPVATQDSAPMTDLIAG